ncbi:MAG: 4Fe-4S binding protein [Thermodesulfobacteriota bacterium]
MNKVVIDRERCKGCGLCISFCPKKILVLTEMANAAGYCPASCVDEPKCIACINCASICPETAFEIYKEVA